MRKVLCAIAVAIPVAVFTQAPADSVSPRAKLLHDRAIVVDSHDDTTQRLIFDKAFDIGKRNPNGNIDIPRMREGGLDALFFSIWVPSDVTGPTAVKRALDQIDAGREAVRTHPHDLMLATTAADVRIADGGPPFLVALRPRRTDRSALRTVLSFSPLASATRRHS